MEEYLSVAVCRHPRHWPLEKGKIIKTIKKRKQVWKLNILEIISVPLVWSSCAVEIKKLLTLVH